MRKAKPRGSVFGNNSLTAVLALGLTKPGREAEHLHADSPAGAGWMLL